MEGQFFLNQSSTASIRLEVFIFQVYMQLLGSPHLYIELGSNKSLTSDRTVSNLISTNWADMLNWIGWVSGDLSFTHFRLK